MSCALTPFYYNHAYWTVDHIVDTNEQTDKIVKEKKYYPASEYYGMFMYSYEKDIVRNMADIQKKLNKILELLENKK